MVIHPFKALRATPESASAVASVPYDVVDTAQARVLAAGRPHSFLHVVRPEIDFEDGIDPRSDAVYAKAAENLQALRRGGHFVQDQEPGLYAYRISCADGHRQVGVLGCCGVDDYENNIVKKHELTRRDKEDDRTRHIEETASQSGPVLVAHAADAGIERALAEIVDQPALLSVRDEADVQHEVWPIVDCGALVEAFARIPVSYIADGHHRSASAARARNSRRQNNSGHTGAEEYNYFLAVMFPAPQLRILAYNRVVHDLAGLTAEDVLGRAAQRFDLQPDADPLPSAAGQFSVFMAGRWTGLRIKPDYGHRGDPVKSLDCSLIQEHFIEPILGIRELRTDPRISFVGGDRGPQALEQAVSARGDGAAFSMFPTSIEQLMAIADADEIMPPKSTWFDPKLRSGLVVHLIED